MLRAHRWQILFLIAFLASFSAIAWGQAARPLTEKEIASLTDLQIPSESIVARIVKGGVAFDVDDAAIDRLKKANASPEVIEALRKAGEIRKSVEAQSGGKPAITYPDVLKLLELGIDENTIIKRLEASPTVFTLGAEQTTELKRAGATERLLKALAGERGAPQAKGDITDFAIVFDCSASMQEKSSNGQTKMAVAQKVVTDLVERVPDGMNLTFVIYGHDKQLNCQAVKIARPLGQIDATGKAQLARTIQTLRPTGNTPIALALRTAGKELTKNDAYSGMVLVTDGKETCNGDPVAEATALAKNPKLSFGIQVVGFDVKPDERKALEEIAAAGKGKYFNAQSADDLAATFDDIARQLKEAAAPPVVASNRRALKVLSPKIDMPELGEVFIVPAESPLSTINSYRIVGVTKYSEEIRVPSSSTKYDVILTPKGEMPIRLLANFSLPERRVVELRPEDYLGMVRVSGKGTPKNIFVAPTGSPHSTAASYAIQRAKKYGEVMVVPAGDYDVYINGEMVEEKLKVEAGKLQELE